MHGEGAVLDLMYQEWFVKFLMLEICHWTTLHTPVLVEVDGDQIKKLRTVNAITMWEITNILKISISSIENHLHQHGHVNHIDILLSH